MKNRISFILSFLFLIFVACTEKEDGSRSQNPSFVLPERAYVLAEQASASVMIVNAETNVVVWQWNPVDAGLTEEEQAWFVNPSEVKPVYGGTCVLMTASGGAVALVRIEDKELLFYAKCGEFPNPHSAEILPDGNIVTVESRYGDVCIFVTYDGSTTSGPVKVARLADAHNAVWDRKHNCIFMTGKLETGKMGLYKFEYNNDRLQPALTNQKLVYESKDESGAHDMFPVYGEDDKLWLTAASSVYKLDVSNPDEVLCEKVYDKSNIKSISNSPVGVIMLKPTESWWSDRLIDGKNETVFYMPGAKIYKARWLLDNTFSYPVNHTLNR